MSADGEELCVRFRVSLNGDLRVRTKAGDKHCLYGAGEEERDDENVVHVRDKEHGYDVAGVSPMDPAVGDFLTG